VRIDAAEFRRALEGIVEFSRLLLPCGGQLNIEGDLAKTGDDTYLELKFSSIGRGSIPVDEKDVFRPFLKVQGRSVGLSMTLAQQILRRHDGEIYFERSADKSATIKILLRILKD
jgi:signal transduction histidine kinase